jgi:hypothetical protein
MNNNNNNGLDGITEIYENLSYFDQYSGSVFLFLIITIVIGLIITYCYIKINSQPVVDNWNDYRCKPYIIPMAGFITHPDGVSATEYTSQNFNYCMQNTLQNIMGGLLSPITFITNLIKNIIDDMANAINGVRAMFDKLRTALNNIVEDIMSRIINITVPLQQIFIGFNDLLHKTQGVMTTSLYTFLGSYFAMKSTMSVIAKMILTILSLLAIAVAAFWLIPPMWPVAIANTLIYTAISIPLAIILSFMNKSLHLNVGKIPKLKCFDQDTLIIMDNGSYKRIIDIDVGDTLFNNNIVTAIFKVETKGSQMYSLDGVLVSDSHIVKYGNSWIPVSKHPNAVRYAFYDKPFLYCLNTINKNIIINSHIFSDWDEVYDFTTLASLKKYANKINKQCDVHKYLDGGFIGSTPIKLNNGNIIQIKDIEVGNVLQNGENVYGIVKLDGQTIENQYRYIVGDNSTKNTINIIGGPNLAIYDKDSKIRSTINLEINKKIPMLKKEDYLYHLLTDKKTFYINNILFCDYNAGIDLFLEK